MAYRLRFNGYDFPSTLRPAGIDAGADLGDQERPRADGSTQQARRLQKRAIQVRGELGGSSMTPDTLQAAYDALKAAVMVGSASALPLYFGRDDRYINAQCTGWTDDWNEGLLYGSVVNIAMTFTAADPYFYATSPTTAGSLSSTGGTITPGGDASAFPVWTITLSNGGAAGAASPFITLSNAANGETCTLTNSVWGNTDVITLDRNAYSVAVNGTPNFGVLTGRIPKLEVGANVVTVSVGGTTAPTVASLACVYTNRWF